jgi:hypothetical protein
MNRKQKRSFEVALRKTNDPIIAFGQARKHGWLPDGKKATTYRATIPTPVAHLHPDKNDRELALSLGVGRGKDAEHRRLSQADKNKKHRLRTALRRAGWVLG